MLPVKNRVLNIDKNAAYIHRIPRIVPMVGYLTNHSVSTEPVYTVAVAKQHLLSRFSTALCAFVWCVSNFRCVTGVASVVVYYKTE